MQPYVIWPEYIMAVFTVRLHCYRLQFQTTMLLLMCNIHNWALFSGMDQKTYDSCSIFVNTVFELSENPNTIALCNQQHIVSEHHNDFEDIVVNGFIFS